MTSGLYLNSIVFICIHVVLTLWRLAYISIIVCMYVCRCLKTYTHFNTGYRRAYFCGTKMQCTLCSMKFTRKIALIVWTRLFGLMKPYLSSLVQGIVTFSCTGALKISTFMGRRQWIYQMECLPEVLLDLYFFKAQLQALRTSTCVGYQMCQQHTQRSVWPS
jgi:hypothetical protein